MPRPAGGIGNCSNSVRAVAPAWCMAERTAISIASRSSRPVLWRALKMTRKQLVYFARDLLLDGFRRFFSWADGWSSSTGRSWQTRSLTSKS